MPDPQRDPPAARRSRSPAASKAKTRRVAIRVESAAPDRRETIAERLKAEVQISGPGLLVSLGLHVVLILLLAMFVVRQRTIDNEPAIDATWRAPRPERTTAAPVAPVKLESLRPLPSTKRSEPAERPEQPPPAAVQNVAVRPANVDRLLTSRSPRRREELLAQNGGDDSTERAVSAGLAWLVRQQQSAGNWRLHEGYPDAGYSNLRTDTGATALSLLAFLGAGQTHLDGEYREVVEKGLQWLRGIQKPNGDFHDHEELGRQTAFYAHAQATIALCEAYALTHDESLREPAQRGVQFLIDAQQQSTGGGWKYRPVHDKGDLSVTGWALMALHTARAAGIDVSESAFHQASLFLDSVQEQSGARYTYEPDDPPSGVSPAMTAEGLLCRQFLGWPADHPPLIDGMEYLTAAPLYPEWSAGRRNVYAWYYTAQVLHNAGGQRWNDWYRAAQQAIVANQVKAGSSRSGKDVRGSWSPVNPPGAPLEYAAQAGRLYVTTFSILILETPYRHQPLHESE